MCLIAVALRASERFPLVIAGNRDEFLARPTLPLDLWHSSQGTVILGGRDAQDGGSWMGFTPQGRFAVLTNVRNPHAATPEHAISRGTLVVDWLDSALNAQDWAQRYDASQFNGFNMIVGDWTAQQFAYLSHPRFFVSKDQLGSVANAPSAMELEVSDLQPQQIYGLSNAALNTPWPKTTRLKSALQAAIELPQTHAITQALMQALSDRSGVPDGQLPSTGVPIEWERALSSAFVSHPADEPRYGTRTSWVAVLEANGVLTLTEATHSHDGKQPSVRQRTMRWRA